MNATTRTEAVRRALTVVLVSVLAACSTVPDTGPIEQGPVVDAGESAQFIRVIAAPPSVGASASDIVRGFLEAMASLESDHAIARRYLTAEAAAAWDPSAQTRIYEPDSLQLTSSSPGRVTATTDITGRLQANGSLQSVYPARGDRHVYRLEQIAGGPSGVREWRIADPPPGVLISELDLRRAFRVYQVHFPSARSGVLVPDGRLLPVVGASLPTALAEGVLAGPAAWLAPGVRSSAPAGTELALGAVPVEDSVAVVDLTEQARAATDAQRRDLGAQLTWTLTELPGITSVRVRVDGEAYEIPGVAELMERASWASRSPDALTAGLQGTSEVPHYVLEGPDVVRVAESSRTSRAVDVPEAESLMDLGVSLDQSTAAAVSADRSRLWLLPLAGGVQQEVTGRDLGGASFDVDGRPWYTDRGRVIRLGPDVQRQEIPVRSQWPGGPVTSVHLARDGVRVLLVVDGLLYLGVIHDDRRARLAVSSVRRIAPTVSDVRDAAWRDSDTLSVLGSAEGQRGRQVLAVSVGTGQARPLGAPSAAREVAAAPGTSTLVTTSDQSLFINVGLQWREWGRARSVAYPG